LILAVASGKGGTGKTTLAVSLAQAAARSLSGDVALLDLDVEAPNAALFLDPVLEERRRAGVPVPEVDPERCDRCGHCVELCRSHALAGLGSSVLVLPELCIGCGVCVRHCPQRAMREVEHELGTLEAGRAGRIAFAQGRLDPGRAQPTPLIRALKAWQLPSRGGADITILDAPPGASCPVMEAARGADHVLLVTEPSPFGLHDLGKAVGALRDAMGLDVSVVINRSMGRDEGIESFCRQRGLHVQLVIPFERGIAAAYAEGTSLLDARPAFEAPFASLLRRLRGRELVA
jgi:MinD superfamily P-loop ATPase